VRWTPEIRRKIEQQIDATPAAEIILPDWAYWKGVQMPHVYVERQPYPLIRVMWEIVVGPLPSDEHWVVNPPGVDPRNINPMLGVVVPTRRSQPVCPNGHRYVAGDYQPGVGHRCEACHQDRLLGTPNAIDINRAKTHCPQNHVLVKRKNGRRRCLECPREQTAAWRARKKEA
jgi:hypothetical protein